jgi:hypothetical protein
MQDEAIGLVRAKVEAGLVMRTASETSDPMNADRLRHIEPISLCATDRFFFLGTDECSVAEVSDHDINVNGSKMNSMIYLLQLDVGYAREWHRDHPILPNDELEVAVRDE